MKLSLNSLLAMLFWATLLQADGNNCVLRLLNGDLIHGAYEGMDDEYLLIKKDSDDEVLRVHGKFVDALDFGKQEKRKQQPFQIFLTPEHRIQGKILSYDNRKLNVQTSWSDELEIDAGYVDKIERIQSLENLLYRGPEHSEKWVYSPPPNKPGGLGGQFSDKKGKRWTLRDYGKLHRPFPLINRGLRLEVEMELPELHFDDSLTVTLGNLPAVIGGRSEDSSRIQVEINQGNLIASDAPVIMAGNRMFRQNSLPRGSSVSPPSGYFFLQVEFDPVNQRHRVRVNEKLIAEWQGEAPDKPGTYRPTVTLEWNLSDSEIQVKEIRLELRDISLPEQSLQIPENTESILFANGDMLNVHWLDIHDDGTWGVLVGDRETSFKLEAERIQVWLNRGEGRKKIKREFSHIHLQMAGGRERFIGELIAANREFFILRREGWEGETRIPVAELELVKFNPYN